MKVHKIVNLIAFENTYILENDRHVIVVDPGSDWRKIQRKLEEIAKPITAILLTHTHYDHIMSLDKVRDNFANPPVYVAESEASWLYTPTDNLSGLDRHAEARGRGRRAGHRHLSRLARRRHRLASSHPGRSCRFCPIFSGFPASGRWRFRSCSSPWHWASPAVSWVCSRGLPRCAADCAKSLSD